MPEHEHFRFVIGEVADTGDKLSTGGTRRSDGTLSAQARNLSYLDDDAMSRLKPTPPSGPRSSFGRDVAADIGRQAVTAAFDVLLTEVIVPGTRKLWTERVVPAASRKWQERRNKKAPGTDPALHESDELIEAELIDEELGAFQAGLDAVDEPSIELSREEAHWRIAEAQRAARDLAEHLAVLRGARVVDDADIPALLEGRGQLEASGLDDAAVEEALGEGVEVELKARQERDVPG